LAVLLGQKFKNSPSSSPRPFHRTNQIVGGPFLIGRSFLCLNNGAGLEYLSINRLIILILHLYLLAGASHADH
jgi:hypothetical protein